MIKKAVLSFEQIIKILLLLIVFFGIAFLIVRHIIKSLAG